MTICCDVGTLAFINVGKFILTALVVNMASHTTVQGVFLGKLYLHAKLSSK